MECVPPQQVRCDHFSSINESKKEEEAALIVLYSSVLVKPAVVVTVLNRK